MLKLSRRQVKEQLQQAKEGLMSHYNTEMEKILNENSDKERYWILGKVNFPEELGGYVGRTFLQACSEKPGLVKNAFLYEVDNTKGIKTLLWVMHPDGSLRFPTLGKTISVKPQTAKSVVAIP